MNILADDYPLTSASFPPKTTDKLRHSRRAIATRCVQSWYAVFGLCCAVVMFMSLRQLRETVRAQVAQGGATVCVDCAYSSSCRSGGTQFCADRTSMVCSAVANACRLRAGFWCTECILRRKTRHDRSAPPCGPCSAEVRQKRRSDAILRQQLRGPCWCTLQRNAACAAARKARRDGSRTSTP